MKFTAAVVLATAAGAYAGNYTVITEVVTQLTTYCPEATTITHGTNTYTVTEPTTLTITDCPCTITRPVITTSVVECHTCGGAPSSVPSGKPPVYGNSTISAAPGVPTNAPAPPAGGAVTPTAAPTHVPTAGAGKVAALSGAGLAGIVGLAAFVL